MKALMIAHALQQFERVVFIIGENNHRSRRAIEKIGAGLMPRKPAYEMAGQQVTHVVYAIEQASFVSGILEAYR